VAINDQAGPGEGIETPEPETSDSAGRPDPAGGGCLRLGWGCLPVIVGAMLIVPGSWLY
jgi:hypothetical protein